MGTKIHPEAINRLHQEAISLQSKGKFQSSLLPLKKIVHYVPHHFPAWHALGIAWRKLQNHEESIQCLEKSLIHCPQYYPAAISLATILYEDLGLIQEGEDILCSLLREHPHLPELHLRLSDVYSRQDNFEQSQVHLQNFIHYQKSADENLKLPIQLLDYQLAAELNIAPFLPCLEYEARNLKNLAKKLDHLISYPEKPKEGLPTLLPLSVFYLAYYQTNPRPFLEKIASIYRDSYPDLTWTHPHLSAPRKKKDKIKIGIVSSYLDKFHPIGFCFSSLIKSFDRDKFSLTYFRLPVEGKDFVFVDMKEQLGPMQCIDLPQDTLAARMMIGDQGVDILWYTDISMVSQTYFLAHARLAPIQCVSAGHPITTGIPTIDYFISSQWLEEKTSQDSYSEKLIQLPTLPIVYEDFPFSPTLQDRSFFSLPEKGHLYFCCQTLFKVHPIMDEVFKKILQDDPDGWIIFSYQGTALAEKLAHRLQQALGPLSERCVFVPRVHQHQFFDLLQCADVLLDTFPFSGGNTSLQGLSMGIPIVTMDSQELKGYSTKALYRLMDMDEGIAVTVEDYAKKCLKIAQDVSYRQHLHKKIIARKHIIFSQKQEVINAYEHMFQEMVASHHALERTNT